MFRRVFALVIVASGTACFDFDGAYRKYCVGAECEPFDGGKGDDAGIEDAGGRDGGMDAGHDGGFDGGVDGATCDASLCLESSYVATTTKVLRAVCGSSASNVWATGWDATWVNWNGAAWSGGKVPLTAYNFSACAATATSVWVGGSDGIFRRGQAGGTWTHELDLSGSNSDQVYGMQAANDSELYAAGWLHWISRSDGGSWAEDYRRTTAPSGTTGPLYDISVAGASVWAVGAFDNGDGIVLKRAGPGDWRPEPIPTLRELADVHAIDEQIAFAVGDRGTVLERNVDGGWKLHSPFTIQDLRAVWASSASDVWVGGFAGELWHWDGMQWQQHAPPGLTDSMDVQDLLGFGTTHLFIGAIYDSRVGSFGDQYDGGYVFHYRRPPQ